MSSLLEFHFSYINSSILFWSMKRSPPPLLGEVAAARTQFKIRRSVSRFMWATSARVNFSWCCVLLDFEAFLVAFRCCCAMSNSCCAVKNSLERRWNSFSSRSCAALNARFWSSNSRNADWKAFSSACRLLSRCILQRSVNFSRTRFCLSRAFAFACTSNVCLLLLSAAPASLPLLLPVAPAALPAAFPVLAVMAASNIMLPATASI